MHQTVLEIHFPAALGGSRNRDLYLFDWAAVPEPLQAAATSDGITPTPEERLSFWRGFWQDLGPSYRPLQWAGWTPR